MGPNMVYVGTDVDDVRYQGCALNPGIGEMLDFHCRPTLQGLGGQLERVRGHFDPVQMRLCYEAYAGFSLRREARDRSLCLRSGRAVEHPAAGRQVGEDGSH